MGFHPRKLLHLGSGDAIMPCRTNCSPIPSPLHSPVQLSLSVPWLSRDHMVRNYALQVAMIVLACTIGVVMFLFTMSRILRYYYSRRYNLRSRNPPILFDIQGDSHFSDDEGPAIGHLIWFIPTVGLQQTVIDSITTCKYRKDEGLVEGTECLVCLGEFQEDESLRLLPKCNHAFHTPCIDTWLRSHKNCPLCRAPIVHDTGNGGGGAELVRTMENDSDFSSQSEGTQIENLEGGTESQHHVEENESSGVRVGDDASGILSSEDGDKILHCHSPSSIGFAFCAHEFEEEIQPMRRSSSMDSPSTSMIFSDMVGLNSDVESSGANFDDKIVSSSKDIAIAIPDSQSSTTYRMASIGHALQKRHFPFKRSSSHNRKFIFSRPCGSQSSTLPL